MNNLDSLRTIDGATWTFLRPWRLRYVEETDSTMDEAWAALDRGEPTGLVVVAARQRAGRGRAGRRWIEPQRALLASVTLASKADELPRLMMVAALATAEAIESLATTRVQLKWPNDVVIAGGKVAGVLVESRLEGDRALAVGGVGVNLQGAPLPDPSMLLPPVALAEVAPVLDDVALLHALVRHLDLWVARLADAETIRATWRSRLGTLGQRVRLESGEWSVEGLAEDVDMQGRLVVRTADGARIACAAGDLRVVPATAGEHTRGSL